MSKHPSRDATPSRSSRLGPERRPFGLDLGNEPPLDATGGAASDVDRRDINLRWLGASVLTGLTGAALLGAAIYVSLDGETTFAEMPERSLPAAPKGGSSDGSSNAARKGDKLVRSEAIALAKQSFRAPMTIRAGDREVIKVRPLVRIATNLSLVTGVHATDIPPFNPLRFFAEESGERYAEPTPEVADADVSVVKSDLAVLSVAANALTLSDDDVMAQVEEERRFSLESGRRSALPLSPQMLLSRTLQPGNLPDSLSYASVTDAPFRSIEVRVVPENVIVQPKSASNPLVEERDVVIGRGETIETVLRANGAAPDQIRSILTALGTRLRTAGIPEGQHLKILVSPGPRPNDERQVMRVILFGEHGVEAIAAANDRGNFVSVAPPTESRPQRPVVSQQDEEEEGEEEGGVRLYESLYETALKNDLSPQTVNELIRIFGYDVDFQRRVSIGDSFEIFYALDEENGNRPEILYASLSVGGEQRRVYRFQMPEDGAIDFFDELGRSLKKFLIRKPIAEGLLRSGYGMRRHPVLGYAKMHTGVDWANRIGTPIVAAGNGTVTKAEWDSGYGRRIEIQHANGYVTAYSHQSRFAAGIKPGAKVRQGQVIGFVGNTGLSTGPHLHYEVIVNGHFQDPMKIKVPRGRELEGRSLADFKRQREQVDGLIEKAGSTRLAQREQR